MSNSIKNLVTFFLVLVATYCGAQEFRVLNISQDNGKVNISFKITPKYAMERYTVEVFSSHDNYQTPLQYVTGDIEGEIESSDQTYQVVGDARKELVTYTGQVQLELKGEVTYLPIHPGKDQVKAKQKKTSTLKWTGGNTSDQVKIELLRNGNVFAEIARTNNSGSYDWAVTREVAKGKGYQLRFTNLNNEGELYETAPFKVGGKLNLVVVGVPVVAGIVAVIVLLGGDGGADLPDPPLPTGN